MTAIPGTREKAPNSNARPAYEGERPKTGERVGVLFFGTYQGDAPGGQGKDRASVNVPGYGTVYVPYVYVEPSPMPTVAELLAEHCSTSDGCTCSRWDDPLTWPTHIQEEMRRHGMLAP